MPDTDNQVNYQSALSAYESMYSGMTPASLNSFGEYFTEDAVFEDPFNRVKGVEAIRRIFEHMFSVCEKPRFEVISTALSGNRAWLHWIFLFGLRGRNMEITGASMVMFADDGRVMMHVDYWDAAGQLYEHLPLVGWLMKLLRKRLSTPGISVYKI